MDEQKSEVVVVGHAKCFVLCAGCRAAQNDFAAGGGKRKGECIGDIVLAAVSNIECTGCGRRQEYHRKLIVFAEDGVFDTRKRHSRKSAFCADGERSCVDALLLHRDAELHFAELLETFYFSASREAAERHVFLRKL